MIMLKMLIVYSFAIYFARLIQSNELRPIGRGTDFLLTRLVCMRVISDDNRITNLLPDWINRSIMCSYLFFGLLDCVVFKDAIMTCRIILFRWKFQRYGFY